ncbi:MAG: proton-conducting transporter membrane subunit, partial [Anaplasmataceae bacterium]|nr:proton-conducting transporter membrane subunit [Anaplasmataceae bacterium]
SNQSWRYVLGGWGSSYGIEFKISHDSLLLISLISLSLFLCSFFIDIAIEKRGLVLSCLFLVITGLIGLVMTNDIFNSYVFLELSSLATYALITLGKDKYQSLKASFDYLIIGTLGATFYLIGIGILYIVSGNLNFDIVLNYFNSNADNTIANLAVTFIVLGLLIKMAVIPFHNWLINSYKNSPLFAVLIFSGVSTKVIIFILYKYFSLLSMNNVIQNTIISSCLVTIIWGGISAYRAKCLRELLAYSSISHIGYIGLALVVSNGNFEMVNYQILYHFVSKVCLFIFVGYIEKKYDDSAIFNLNGFLYKDTKLTIILYFLLANLIGLPFLFGFTAKLMLMNYVINSSNIYSALLLIFGNLISLMYCFKLVFITFDKKT